MSEGPQRTELLSWEDVDNLITQMVPQIQSLGNFQAMVMITRGGVIPGGMLAEALNIQHILTAAVDFPATRVAGLMGWPQFLQFPDSDLLVSRKCLIVDDVWGSGRTSTSVKERVIASGGSAFTCVMHFNPYRSLFTKAKPDFFGAATDAYIVYPWEIDRGMRGVDELNPEPTPGLN